MIRDTEFPWSDLARAVVDSLEPVVIEELEEVLEGFVKSGVEISSSDASEGLDYVLCVALSALWKKAVLPIPADCEAIHLFDEAHHGVMERTLKRTKIPMPYETACSAQDSRLMLQLSKDVLDSILLMQIQGLAA